MLYQLYMLLNGITMRISYGRCKAVVTHLQVTYQHWSGQTKRTSEKPQSCVCVCVCEGKDKVVAVHAKQVLEIVEV